MYSSWRLQYCFGVFFWGGYSYRSYSGNYVHNIHQPKLIDEIVWECILYTYFSSKNHNRDIKNEARASENLVSLPSISYEGVTPHRKTEITGSCRTFKWFTFLNAHSLLLFWNVQLSTAHQHVEVGKWLNLAVLNCQAVAILMSLRSIFNFILRWSIKHESECQAVDG